MSSNYDILHKYIYNFETSKDIPMKVMEEDLLKIKPVNIPIQDILTMKIIGDYIFKLSTYLKWSYYDSIDIDIINLCKKEWSNIHIDYAQIIKLIYNAKLEYKDIKKVQYEILKYIDNKYQEHYSIKEAFLKKDIKSCDNYLVFRQESNKYIEEIFNKYNLELNEIDLKCEDFVDKISENFIELESDENFNDTTMLIDSIEDIIDDKINSLIKHCVKEFKLANQDEKNPFVLQDLKNNAMDNFVLKMDEIYKIVCFSKLKKLDETIIVNILELFIVNKEISKSMFLLELNFF